MSTTNYNFTTVSGTDAIDIESAINTPLTQIDNILFNNSYPYSELHVCGDSFSNETTEWPSIVANTINTNLINHAVAGAAFTSTSNSIVTQIQNAINSAPKNSLLIVYGGINDWNDLSASVTSMNSAMQTCLDYIKSAAINKKIRTIFAFGNMGKCGQAQYANYPTWYRSIYQNLQTIGMPGLVYGVPCWLLGRSNVFNTDNLHPNSNGEAIIAGYFLQIINGTFTGSHYEQVVTSSVVTNSSTYNGKAIWNFHDNLINVRILSSGQLPYNNSMYRDVDLHISERNMSFGGPLSASYDYEAFMYPAPFSKMVISTGNIGFSSIMINTASGHVYGFFFGLTDNLLVDSYANTSITYNAFYR